MFAHAALCARAQVWKIKRFAGACEHSLRAEVTMVSTTKERKPWARPPISMNFQVTRAARATSAAEHTLPRSTRYCCRCCVGGACGRCMLPCALLHPLCQRASLPDQPVRCLVLRPRAPAALRSPRRLRRKVPMFAASGLRVAYLKILERRQGSQYQVEKWVRKMCKSGDFLVRI